MNIEWRKEIRNKYPVSYFFVSFFPFNILHSISFAPVLFFFLRGEEVL